MTQGDPSGLAVPVERALRGIRTRVAEVFASTPDPLRYKDDGSAVTDLDLELEQQLADALLAIDPSFGLVGEESGEFRAGTPTWYLDPLDGTANFTRRIASFGSQVVLLDGLRPLFAAVYEPLRDEFTWAAEGCGTWREGRRVHVGERATEDALVYVDLAETGIFPKDPTLLPRLRASVYKVRASGTIALHMRDVAVGRADGYLGGRETPAPLHDLAPGVLLVGEAGGRVSDGRGGDPLETRKTLVAGSEAIHGHLCRLLADS